MLVWKLQKSGPSEIERCVTLAIKSGKEVKCSGIDLGERRVIQSIDDEGCKYLGILVKGELCQQTMK